jgi:hypothetical protein
MSDINRAMINTLNVFTGDKTLEELIISDEGYFVFKLEDMLDYFASVEDFERCSIVKKIIDEGRIVGRDLRI